MSLPFLDIAPGFVAYIRLGLKGLPGKHTIAYYVSSFYGPTIRVESCNGINLGRLQPVRQILVYFQVTCSGKHSSLYDTAIKSFIVEAPGTNTLEIIF